jgi:hypothetical protein
MLFSPACVEATMSERRLLRVRVEGDRRAIETFLAAHPPGCERIERVGERLAITVFIRADALDAWRRTLAVKILFDVATRMQRLARMVGQGDRFAGGAVPTPLGLAGRGGRG